MFRTGLKSSDNQVTIIVQIMANTAAAARVEAVVIGAGVIGLSIARSLAQRGKEVLILERAGRIGSGQ